MRRCEVIDMHIFPLFSLIQHHRDGHGKSLDQMLVYALLVCIVVFV